MLAALWQLRPFLVLAYGLTWVLLGPWFYLFNVVYQGNFPTWMVPLIPFAFIGGWGPSVAALIVTLWQERLSGVRKLVRSLGAWRVPVRWYLLALVVPPLVTAVSLLVVDRGATTLRGFDPVRALANLPVAYGLALPFGPLGEELGWRGYALPRLLAAVGPVKASLTLGVVWTFWHVPMMLWSPGASIPSFMGLSVGAIAVYLVQITAITVLMTVLFLRTKGIVLSPSSLISPSTPRSRCCSAGCLSSRPITFDGCTWSTWCYWPRSGCSRLAGSAGFRGPRP